MKNKLLISLTLIFSINCYADYDIDMLKEQRLKIDKQIETRNNLVDKLKDDSYNLFLSKININELGVEFNLKTLESILLIQNNIEKLKDIEKNNVYISKIKSDLSNSCANYKHEMLLIDYKINNEKIEKQVEIQIENIRTACDMISGTIVKNGKFIKIY